ncbi:hypothetical protein FHS43_005381 [Streptosporangium becharense]|uniref:AcrR family transcriptional regulator n=1 Tax=Streptosporangium becharense TaxID=1816182 RepID=A0A7W9IB23_9ACTN|nr:NACHT domain-containing protein [Streptosporangium becharense]MBB2914069.1 hypothetical protein [Streptosporangium becharense]MBB5817096.1 AcrR family transcriptional regulator [Streptosporangium becharense]
MGRAWSFKATAAMCAVVAVGAVAWTWSRWKGDVDPVGAVIGLGSAGLAMAAWRQGRLAQRAADADLQVWSGRLAVAVLQAETKQRAQLLGESAVIDVEFTFRRQGSPVSAAPRGSLQEVVAYFRGLDAPQRVVVTGPAGAGKTVLAVQLIIGLLTGRAPDDPIPIRLSAASWDTGVPVADWLAGHLTAAFALSPVTARALVETGRILPFIDGLDEMDETSSPGFASRAGQVLRALDGYQHGLTRSRLVVTCRTGQYDALVDADAGARATARIELTRVSGDKAWRFIQAVTDQEDPARWQPVLDALTSGGGVLAGALSTPWQLTLVTTVYQERDPASGRYLRDPQELTELTSEEEVHQHLLRRFVHARVTAAGGRGAPAPEQAHAWLAVLAGYLHANEKRPPFAERALSATDLVPHELWPLAGHRPRHVAVLVFRAVGLLMAGLLLVQIWSKYPDEPTLPNGLITVGCVVFVRMVGSGPWMQPWYAPKRIDLSRFRTAEGLRRLAWGVRVVLPGAFAYGVVFAFVLGPATGASFGVSLGLVIGIAAGLTVGAPAAADARTVIRYDTAGALTLVLIYTLATGLICTLVAQWPAVLAVTCGLAVSLFLLSAAPLMGGPASLRYLAFLLCTRGLLPWRLGRFLDWCYGAGLLRISGIAYQFRHLELRDHLAAHPESRPTD